MMNAAEILQNTLPDKDYVYITLDGNDQKLVGVAQQMGNTVRNAINANVDKLTAVENRIRSSVNGHIRGNVARMKPIVEKLATAIHDGIDQAQAGINMIVSRPQVQDWLKRNGQSPAWSGIVPPPPQPGDIVGTLPDGATDGGPTPAFGLLTEYALWYHCATLQAIGVPNQSPNDIDLLLGQGWKRFPKPASLHVRDKAEVTAYLNENRAKILRLCAQG